MLYAITVTVMAGLSTGLGGLCVLLFKKPSEKILALSLGFASGVMITVSLSDMVPHTVLSYSKFMNEQKAALCAASLCAMGMVIAHLIAKLVPDIRPIGGYDEKRANIMKSAIVTTLALVAHNLPEGVLTLFTNANDPAIGTSLALAVAMHNIPEGIAIAVPVFYATKSRLKGFFYALASGVAEPVGALLAYGLLSSYISPLFLNGIIAAVAGIMLYVSFDELLYQGFLYSEKALATLGVCSGILTMHIGIYLV